MQLTKNQSLTKQDLRRTLRASRKQLKSEDREQRAKQIVAILETLPVFEQAQHIGLYWPYDGEVYTLPLMEKIWSQGKASYLPCLSATKQDKMLVFKHYQANDPMTINQFNIYEPAAPHATILAPQELDLVFVPVVAFNLHGHRIGMGGGYYDTTFSFINNHHDPAQTKPILIGVAYSFQQVAQMPINPWDIRLTGIVTEYRYIPTAT